ncbi:hypothetical protein RhiirC2_796252 [Rhizophagus irregularis]|uniref:DUF8211 domain-containing protein n=1 Tax=Rhizophagus irregularis TaxID=588596 RepID=A0A2N1MA20_9GLOM|nr:hypothetical protein RhiirC2_796252 [Rhizophagus irregularis]
MTSTKYVDIDWSSASQHSFPQLGNLTPNNDNLDTGFIVTENSEVLSFEDIFFLDIDDIYPFTYSTLHYEEPEPDDTYEINNYYDNMLKDALAAPISIEQVIPQHSTTPLTLIDTDVTPPSSTSKFFSRADTADFENINLGYDDKNDFSDLPLISPIHSQAPTETNTPKKDKLPSPDTVLPTRNPLARPSSAINNSLPHKLLAQQMMILSRANSDKERNNSTKTFFNFMYKRYHFHFGIYTPCQYSFIYSGLASIPHICDTPAPFIMSKNRRACITHQREFFRDKLYKKSKVESDTKSVDNTKAIHANLIYERWKSGTKKTVTSNRLGISYQESIHTRDVASVLVYGNKHMYRKRLSNFHLLQSKHAGVKKKQETHRLRAAHLYRFLFLKSQYVNKPVKHLIYNHGLVSDDYGFRTPHYYMTLNHVTSHADGRPKAKGHARLTSPYPTTVNIPWVRPYNPYPDMFIPHKYRNIIPDNPLYTDTGDFIVPGSREWFIYMSALHRSNPNDEIRQQQRQTQRLNEAHIRKQEELLQRQRNDAILHGTSTHTLPR